MPLFKSKRRTSAPPSGQAAAPAASGDASAESRILALGSEMLDRARGHKAGILSAKFYSDKLMNWSMKDQNFKVQMFRFVDCFPVLTTPEMIHDHLTDYLTQPGVKLPPGFELGIKAGGLAKGLFAGTISSQIKGMASKFIAGTDAASALPRLKSLWKDGIAFSVDLLGEACVSDAEADAYQAKYADLVENLPETVAGFAADARLERDHLGGVPRVNVSIKISSLSAKFDPIDTEGSINDLMRRLVPVLEAARERGVFVNFDMEQFKFKDLTLELFFRCCEAVDFHAGLAMQAYLKSGPDDARRVVEWAKRTGRIVSVRLVKGAYWDYETIHAEEQGWPCPVWNEKWQTDRCFEEMTRILLDACPKAPATAGLGPTRLAPGSGGVKLALGSHNVRSIAAALVGLEQRGLPREAIELQMLHGMADELKYAAAEMGLRVREYVPVGEMIPGMAYLVRRLLENTSNESWLRAGFIDNADVSELLAAPGPKQAAGANGSVSGKPDLYLGAPERHRLSPAVEGVGNGRPFQNEAMRNFAFREQREAFARAVAVCRVPQVANDRTTEQAREMVTSAAKAFNLWRDADPRARAGVLIEAAEAMRRRRDELAGVMIKESGKTWREADADVCEAIDFCEYYARLAVPMFERERIGRFFGELDEQLYQPRGVTVVISPWNFPLAICCGMTVAALVTGNTVVVKPAEQTPGIARLMTDVLHESLERVFGRELRAEGSRRGGVPVRDVLHFCPAPGETTGAALVRDPRVALIAFTGSRDVGLDILTAAAPGSPFIDSSIRDSATHVKRVVCEMGGKNAIIIDSSADLDEAVLGVRHSAFGFQGQKCSACSRLIVVDPQGPDGPHMETFKRRFVEATRALVPGDPAMPGTDVGPVIDREAADRIRGAIAKAKAEGCTLELAMETPANLPGGMAERFVGPHIFSGVTPKHAIAREEIFGPVVAVMHASSFDDALDMANDHVFKLTGGVYSRKPEHLERAKREFRVGNLYLNRSCTGALVARQPFGGFGMSGVGSKAGGKDYLLQFVEPRAICENTLRRGFAPEL
ncbi:MAG: proline dehydrogenase family protein [Phycisphaeraceae bacterium]|nr:proline dehydrogenase family protein [Phycisphaeraceae bacterium]